MPRVNREVGYYCVYCKHSDDNHKVTELPGDRSQDIYADGRLCLPYRPYRRNCFCGCDDYRWDIERFIKEWEEVNKRAYILGKDDWQLTETDLLVFSLQVFEYPKFLEAYAAKFGKPKKGPLWDPGEDVNKFSKMVKEGIIKPRKHTRSVRDMALDIYGAPLFRERKVHAKGE